MPITLVLPLPCTPPSLPQASMLNAKNQLGIAYAYRSTRKIKIQTRSLWRCPEGQLDAQLLIDWVRYGAGPEHVAQEIRIASRRGCVEHSYHAAGSLDLHEADGIVRVSSRLVNRPVGKRFSTTSFTHHIGERLLLAFVHVVDDNASFRVAIERRLRSAGYGVGTYSSAQDFLDRLPNETERGCILLDVNMPGLSGPEVQLRLRELGSTLPIVFLTGLPDISTTVRTIKAGAEDFLVKPVSSDDLFAAIERAVAHHDAALDSKSKLDVIRAQVATLTPREREVFDCIIRGQTNKQAARALGCTERTIKAHRQRVMEKMRAQTLAELVSLAERVGFSGAVPAI
jgi:RNA polymerase sigma factor (sigma-70 family)